MQAACALGHEALSEDSLDPATREEIGMIVSKYLPGMDTSNCDIRPQSRGCDGSDHECPAHQIGIYPNVEDLNKTKVITLSKSLNVDSVQHPNFARLTVDAEGKIIKLAVSR